MIEEKCFQKEALSHEELVQIPVSALAYLGDAVYELYVRERLLKQAGCQSGSLFKASLKFVEAKGQAAILDYLLPELTEEERDVSRRARNHVPHSRPRNSDPLSYRKASALEALCAWLWLGGQKERLEELLERAFAYIEKLETEESNAQEEI